MYTHILFSLITCSQAADTAARAEVYCNFDENSQPVDRCESCGGTCDSQHCSQIDGTCKRVGTVVCNHSSVRKFAGSCAECSSLHNTCGGHCTENANGECEKNGVETYLLLVKTINVYCNRIKEGLENITTGSLVHLIFCENKQSPLTLTTIANLASRAACRIIEMMGLALDDNMKSALGPELTADLVGSYRNVCNSKSVYIGPMDFFQNFFKLKYVIAFLNTFKKLCLQEEPASLAPSPNDPTSTTGARASIEDDAKTIQRVLGTVFYQNAMCTRLMELVNIETVMMLLCSLLGGFTDTDAPLKTPPMYRLLQNDPFIASILNSIPGLRTLVTLLFDKNVINNLSDDAKKQCRFTSSTTQVQEDSSGSFKFGNDDTGSTSMVSPMTIIYFLIAGIAI